MRSSLSTLQPLFRPALPAWRTPRFLSTSVELVDDAAARVFCLRCTRVRAGAGHDYVDLWAIYEDRARGRSLSVQQRFEDGATVARLRGAEDVPWYGCVADGSHRVSWQVPRPEAGAPVWRIDPPLSCVGFALPEAAPRGAGVLELAEGGGAPERISMEGWRLSRCGASGHGMPEYLAQIRCARFEGAPTAHFDALCVQGRRATLLMPALRYGRLRLGEREFTFAPLANFRQAPCSFGPAGCDMRLVSDEASVNVRTRLDPEAAHVAVYQTATAFSHWFASSLTHLELEVRVDGAARTLTSTAASYLEVQPPPNRHMRVEMA
jgi:hypothetical protein